jgi:methionine synthase II (cobalamin-independent)
MTMRTDPPFRAEHVGSLLRPPELVRAREDHAAGRIDDDELSAILDQAVRDAARMQESLGFQLATDGEFPRQSWHMDFIYQLGGVRPAETHQQITFHNPGGDITFAPAMQQVTDRITLERTIFADHLERLQAAVTTAMPKLTIPSPSMVHYRGGRAWIDESVYPEMDQFWNDVSAAYADEVRQLHELGLTYLQLDDTCFAYLNDPRERAAIVARGEDGEHMHLRYIKQFNESLADRPEGMTIAVHMCRGNFRSSWVAEGGYDYVAEALFNDLDVDAFFMEWDDARSGGFEPLRYVPKGKLVVLGLVTSKRPALESKDGLKRRIEEAARYVPLDQLCLSPQCGFSSTAEGNALTQEQQEAKLRLVVETAQEVWE